MKKPIHTATPRIQKILVKLQRYNINFVYKPGKYIYIYIYIYITDTLSRAYQQADKSEIRDYNAYDVMNTEVLSNIGDHGGSVLVAISASNQILAST